MDEDLPRTKEITVFKVDLIELVRLVRAVDGIASHAILIRTFVREVDEPPVRVHRNRAVVGEATAVCDLFKGI